MSADFTSLDIEAYFAELGQHHPGKGRYGPLDRYRDFRAVFLGSDQGKRVLYEILSMGHMFRPAPIVGNFETNQTMFAGGEQNLAYGVFLVAHAEPKQPPGKQVSKEPEG